MYVNFKILSVSKKSSFDDMNERSVFLFHIEINYFNTIATNFDILLPQLQFFRPSVNFLAHQVRYCDQSASITLLTFLFCPLYSSETTDCMYSHET